MMKKSRFMVGVGLCLICFSDRIYAQEAQWIWLESDGPKNTWVAFRKEFDLDKVPGTALADISTDTKYWLWINGEMVLFEGGLARGPSPDGTYYDPVDIKRLDKSYGMKLISPEGTIAVIGIAKASFTPKIIEANGSTLWKKGAFIGSVSGITWNGEDEKYIKFKVAPGTWFFNAR